MMTLTKTAPTLLVSLLLALTCFALTGCNTEDNSGSTDSEQTEETTEQENDSITAHGSTYEKAETVQASTTLTGEVTGIAVEEWLKNPEGLETITDASTLQQIAAESENTTYTQDGEMLTWTTNGEDVHYSGITDQELPFSLSYTYKLDGNEVDPATLQNATGHLEVQINYTNNTSGTVNAGGSSHAIKDPLTMATLMSFDSEHATNVAVDNGQVMDQDGSFVAVGMAMPGLAASLDLDDVVDLPESVTISADVTGFDMPSITTMATSSALSMVSESGTGEIDSQINDLFSQTSSITEAIDKLGQGTSAISSALDQISAGQTKLNQAFPNATDGLGKLGEASSGVEQLVSGAQGATQAANAYEAAAAQQLETLRNIDRTGMSDEAQASLDSAIAQMEANLTAAQQYSSGADSALTKAGEVSGQLTSGISTVSEGLAQIQAGYNQLGEATTKVSEASVQLNTGVETMGTQVQSALKNAQGSINGKIDLIEALGNYAKDKGAFCGNASDMPATTTYIVTAES